MKQCKTCTFDLLCLVDEVAIHLLHLNENHSEASMRNLDSSHFDSEPRVDIWMVRHQVFACTHPGCLIERQDERWRKLPLRSALHQPHQSRPSPHSTIEICPIAATIKKGSVISQHSGARARASWIFQCHAVACPRAQSVNSWSIQHINMLYQKARASI